MQARNILFQKLLPKLQIAQLFGRQVLPGLDHKVFWGIWIEPSIHQLQKNAPQPRPIHSNMDKEIAVDSKSSSPATSLALLSSPSSILQMGIVKTQSLSLNGILDTTILKGRSLFERDPVAIRLAYIYTIIYTCILPTTNVHRYNYGHSA